MLSKPSAFLAALVLKVFTAESCQMWDLVKFALKRRRIEAQIALNCPWKTLCDLCCKYYEKDGTEGVKRRAGWSKLYKIPNALSNLALVDFSPFQKAMLGKDQLG